MRSMLCHRLVLLLAPVVFAAGWAPVTTFAEPRRLAPAPTPVDNPLKGLVPYARPEPDRFPHSMEFSYLALSELMTGPKTFNWQPLEKLLDDVASRGNQTIFRVFLEYPGKKEGIPEFLVKQGLKVHVYKNTNTAPLPPAEIRTPDYADPNLRSALQSFIAALGERYDGDPRIAYITAGLLGTWGEWHTYPRNDLWASVEVQAEVLSACEAAFHQTPVLLRYPAGPENEEYASNAERPFGYHDDSFAWATLDTGRKQDDWFYLVVLRNAGQAAVDKWKSQPIGGEIRPEIWGQVFDLKPKHKQAQDFARCVEQTHVTWLMDTGMFRQKADPTRYERATSQVRRMGYEFCVESVDLTTRGEKLSLTAKVVNQGVAPFYRDWPVELGFLDETGNLVESRDVDWSLVNLLPGDAPRVWTVSQRLPQTARFVALRVVNPLPNGKLFHFANADQNRHAQGWLTLGAVPGRN
jgi:hypothetical protein